LLLALSKWKSRVLSFPAGSRDCSGAHSEFSSTIPSNRKIQVIFSSNGHGNVIFRWPCVGLGSGRRLDRNENDWIQAEVRFLPCPRVGASWVSPKIPERIALFSLIVIPHYIRKVIHEKVRIMRVIRPAHLIFSIFVLSTILPILLDNDFELRLYLYAIQFFLNTTRNVPAPCGRSY